jgi:hypothetical protein
LDLSPVRKSFYEIGKLLITLIFINHIFSCIWILIGRASIMNNLDSWLDSENPRYQYVNAMYYTHVTMTSVGYGDVSPKSTRSNLNHRLLRKTLLHLFLTCFLAVSFLWNRHSGLHHFVAFRLEGSGDIKTAGDQPIHAQEQP